MNPASLLVRANPVWCDSGLPETAVGSPAWRALSRRASGLPDCLPAGSQESCGQSDRAIRTVNHCRRPSPPPFALPSVPARARMRARGRGGRAGLRCPRDVAWVQRGRASVAGQPWFPVTEPQTTSTVGQTIRCLSNGIRMLGMYTRLLYRSPREDSRAENGVSR